MRSVLVLGIFLASTAAAAAFGALFQPGAWYATLVKPPWTPPNAIFGPVWTVLYVLIALSGWLVWRAGDRGLALGLWALQLVLNALWSWLFFGLHAIGWALADIGLLWLAIAAFVAAAWRRAPIAGLLFLPYAAWVGYAATLNLAIWRLNG